MSLNVTIPDTFNGPLDLLLHLIRRDEMDIYDIPIALLTNSYLEEMGKLEIIDVDEGAEFLDLASRLLEIKSRMLIPPDELEDSAEEEDEDFDPRSGLVEALLEYRRFKDAAKMLGDMAEEQARRYPRISPRMEFTFVQQAATSSSNDLMRAFQSLLDRMLTVISDTPDVITYTEVSISTRQQQIVENLAAVEKTRFSRLLSDAPSKSEMVGLFIAMLELVRQGKIIARQTDNFSDIIIERREAILEPSVLAITYASLPPVSFFPALKQKNKRAVGKKSKAAAAVFPAAVPGLRRIRQAGKPRSALHNTLFPALGVRGKRKTASSRSRKR